MATAAIKPQAKPPVTGSTFHGLPPALARELEMITLTNHYPTGAVLFSEGQTARGIYVVQRGLVKVSVCASDGRTLILRIARAGDALGVASTIGSREYEATAEAQQPCDVTFIRQSDVLRMMRVHGEFALWITHLLSSDYNSTCREIRTLMLSGSASEKLARLLVGWLDERGGQHPERMKVPLTHEEIGQMIRTSRETVTRLMAGFRKQTPHRAGRSDSGRFGSSRTRVSDLPLSRHNKTPRQENSRSTFPLAWGLRHFVCFQLISSRPSFAIQRNP